VRDSVIEGQWALRTPLTPLTHSFFPLPLLPSTALSLNMTSLATDRTVCELEDMLAAHRLASPQADSTSALLAPLAAVVRALRLQDPAPTAGQARAAVEGFVLSLPTEQGAEAVLERLLAVAKGAVGVCAGGAVVYYQLDVITVNWVVPPPGVTG
jgi:hypothetical protein